jgi:23S rRNA pseudouridine1911/1915/1917 synthase
MAVIGIRHPLILAFLSLVVSHVHWWCWAFTAFHHRLPAKNLCPRLSDEKRGIGLIKKGPSVWAKPPPTSSFDLDAIEAFEAAMDLKQQLGDFDEFDGSDLDGDDDGDDEFEESPAGESIRYYTVPQELHGKRIDAVLSTLEPTLSRSVWASLIADGCVHLLSNEGGGNGSTSSVFPDRKSYKVEAGSTLRVVLPLEQSPSEIVAQNLPLNILYEDEHMIILNKAAGMVVHPAAGNWDGTVVNALAYYLAKESKDGAGDFVDSDGRVRWMTPTGRSTTNGDRVDDPEGINGETTSFRPGIVHRLDKGTTGILVVAKTTQALSTLSAAFAARKVKKTYLAITGE